jgi:hypothetical protein
MGIAIIGTTNDGEVLGSMMELPVTRGLELFAIAGVDETRSRWNRADILLPAATRNGAPAFTADRITGCNLANNLEWAVPETPDFTLILFADPETIDLSVAANRPNFGGYFQAGAAPEGAGVFFSSPTLVRGAASYMEAGVATTRYASLNYVDPELLLPRAYALVAKNGVGHSFYDLTKTALAPAVHANTNPRAVSSRGLRLGGGFGGNNGPCSAFAAIKANVDWSKAEIDSAAAFVANHLKKYRNVTGFISTI